MSQFGENLLPNGESRLDDGATPPVDAARAASVPSLNEAALGDEESARDANTDLDSPPASDIEETLEADPANPELSASGDRHVDDGIEPFHSGELTALPPGVEEARGGEELAAGLASADADLLTAPAEAAPASAAGYEPWEPNDQARQVAVELRRVEMEIRELLENCDNKRKRKYEGTRRWLELMEDLVAMRYTGPADEATLARVSALVARRMYLFNMLNFIVATRHRWNT